MKKCLLAVIVFFVFSATIDVSAQCTVSNPTITNVSRVSNGNGTCNVKFDLSFTMQNNNGNKTIVIHLWPGNSYPSPAICYMGGGCGQPSAAKLAGSYGSIVINNDGAVPTFYSTYPFRPGINIIPTNPVISRTGGVGNAAFNFTVKEITLNNVACNGGVVVKGDIWSTNAGSLSSNTNPQCSTSGIFLNIGDPTITGFKSCTDPRRLNFGVSTSNSTPITVTYKIYKSDGNSSFDPSQDIDVTLPGTDPISVSATNSPQGRSIGFVGNNSLGEKGDYWVVITHTPVTGSTYNIALLLPNGQCASLPVEFKSFTANRDESIVKLVWETAVENNSKGFEVQRMAGGNQWETVAFVKSLAAGGNSSAVLHYTYNDDNASKGATQYRIRQVDLDGGSKYSVIRSVNGKGSIAEILIYPNPSTDGKITLSFKNAGAVHDVVITDASGRQVRKWKAIVNDNLQVNNLGAGFYTISVTNTGTGETVVQKLIINKY